MERVVTPAPVPLSGFLNLSAVSRQIQASGPCFVPLPPLGFLLQSLPLARIAHPSRGHLLPCGHPPACWIVAVRALSPPVSATPALTRSCLLPLTTMSSLSAPPEGDASRSLRARATEPNRSARFTHFEALILSRVRSRQPELPRTSGRSSLGLLPLQSLLLPRLGSSDPPRPRGPEHAPPPEGQGTT